MFSLVEKKRKIQQDGERFNEGIRRFLETIMPANLMPNGKTLFSVTGQKSCGGQGIVKAAL